MSQATETARPGGPAASGPATARTRRSAILAFVAANQWVLILLLTIGLGIFTGLINDRFFNPRNIISILEQSSVLGLVAAGATILIISGNFDISVGAIIGLSAVAMAMIVLAGVPEELAMLVGHGRGHHLQHRQRRAGAALPGTHLHRLAGHGGHLHGHRPGPDRGHHPAGAPTTSPSSRARACWAATCPSSSSSACSATWPWACCSATPALGRRTYAIGDNPRAAYLAGIDVSRTTVVLFAINGILVGVAAIMLISRIGSALPSTGAGLELRAIGAVVIGGVPITGGRGGVVGTFFGVLLLGVISNMLNMLHINPFLQEIAFGALIVLAIGISWLRTRVGSDR